ncbi:MAG: DUF1365 domain-containing protein [Leptospiraceae bacterium]|nr:DUF1365 domain-containing protein [Leptospiraceae bacterium]MDW8305801.1 DUF1365 domain-containing protein [Leptospiraceae bacterium]
MKKRYPNSCLYLARLYHYRERTCKHYFSYPVYFWYLDLEEIEKWGRRSRILGYERFALFSFYEKDHGLFLAQGTLREKLYNLILYENWPLPQRIRLLTNLRVLGYVFNPVSFYFLFDKEDRAYGVVVEVNNTFGEQKAYLLKIKNDFAQGEETKWFYVSPFIRHDSRFCFSLHLPNETLRLRIDTRDDQGIELKAAVWGKKIPITWANIFYVFCRYPLYTLFVIGRIHYHALLLYLKRIPFYRKKETDIAILKAKGGYNETPSNNSIVHGQS